MPGGLAAAAAAVTRKGSHAARVKVKSAPGPAGPTPVTVLGPPAGPVAVSERSESESRQPEFRAAGAVSGPSESESAGGPGLRAYDSGPGPPARAPAGMRVVASAATGGGPGPA